MVPTLSPVVSVFQYLLIKVEEKDTGLIKPEKVLNELEILTRQAKELFSTSLIPTSDVLDVDSKPQVKVSTRFRNLKCD